MSNTDGRADSRPSPQQGAVPAPTTIAGAVRLSYEDEYEQHRYRIESEFAGFVRQGQGFVL